MAEGWLGGTYGVTDDNRFIGVVRFESKEAAARNAARPEQDAWWSITQKSFDGKVTFHDCDEVALFLDGGSFALAPDGHFTQTVAFRSEAEARAGESKEMPEDVGKSWEDAMALMQDVTYLDLRHPWFASKT